MFVSIINFLNPIGTVKKDEQSDQADKSHNNFNLQDSIDK